MRLIGWVFTEHLKQHLHLKRLNKYKPALCSLVICSRKKGLPWWLRW